jgi:hypothetical protein
LQLRAINSLERATHTPGEALQIKAGSTSGEGDPDFFFSDLLMFNLRVCLGCSLEFGEKYTCDSMRNINRLERTAPAGISIELGN